MNMSFIRFCLKERIKTVRSLRNAVRFFVPLKTEGFSDKKRKVNIAFSVQIEYDTFRKCLKNMIQSGFRREQ